MLAMKWLLEAAGVAMFGSTAGVVGYDVYLAMQFQKLMNSGKPGVTGKAGPCRPMRWPLAMKLFGWAWAPQSVIVFVDFVPNSLRSTGQTANQLFQVREADVRSAWSIFLPDAFCGMPRRA